MCRTICGSKKRIGISIVEKIRNIKGGIFMIYKKKGEKIIEINNK